MTTLLRITVLQFHIVDSVTFYGLTVLALSSLVQL
ncbi:hypothetical protein LINPERPRIM_LOCUS29158 [Linum perenne]